MALHRGSTAGVSLPPTVTPQAASNYNQSQFTASAYVSANMYPTTVYFDYSTSSTFSSYTTVTHWVTVTGDNYYAYYNVTGLTPNTTYYYRCRATSAIGTTIGATNSFTTWMLKTYLNTSQGGWAQTIPSITPYGGSPIAPTIYEMLMYGAGGGAGYSGGGGGGYRLFSSYTSTTGGTQTINGYNGAGGQGNGQGGGYGTAGEDSTLTIAGTTWTAGGGGYGGWLQNPAGSVGSGQNPAYVGGSGYYGYRYVSSYNQWTDPSCGCCATDKWGNCTGYCTCNNPNSPNYSYDYSRYAGGGGGGTDSNGASAGYPDQGGTGGAGGGAYGLRGGNGGGGGGTASWGSAGSLPGWSSPVVGTGGTGWFGHGLQGGITFKYYGP